MSFNFQHALDIVAPVCPDCGEGVTRNLVRYGGESWHKACLERVQSEAREAEAREAEANPETPHKLGFCPICRMAIWSDERDWILFSREGGKPAYVHSRNCEPRLREYIRIGRRGA